MSKTKNSFILDMMDKKNPANNSDNNLEIKNDNENLNSENEIIPIISKSTPKGDKSSLFVQNCVTVYQNLELSKNEKVTLNINPEINKKLKLVAIAANVSATDLGNAIIYNFFETHKKEISILMKKLQI